MNVSRTFLSADNGLLSGDIVGSQVSALRERRANDSNMMRCDFIAQPLRFSN